MELKINGESVTLEVEPETPLLWVLREQAGLTGTKFGCGVGACGACTVHLSGIAMRSCVLPVAAAIGQEITTIEGLSAEGPHAVELDLMEPVDPTRSPRVNSPALNHIGLWVDDLHAAVDWLKEQGVRVLGEISPGAAGHDVCFIHPRGNEAAPVGATGVLLELVQAPAEVIAALGASRE